MLRVLTLAVIFSICSFTWAAEQPAAEAKKAAPKPAEYLIGEMHQQTIPAQDYFESPESVNNVVQIQMGVK
jgi:uncharacterized protein YpmB